MPENPAHILLRLQREILPLQGLKLPAAGQGLELSLGPIADAFPNQHFPVGAVHELISFSREDAAATQGFIAALTGSLMRTNGAVVWVGAPRTVFPPALSFFGIRPDQIVFIELQKEKNILWTIEEALKTEGLAAVIGEIPELNFTVSRRLQLAVEQSRVTGFIHRHRPRLLQTNACVSRWQIRAIPSALDNDLPGVGFPRWQIELQKIRNGKPGCWKMEWVAGRFRALLPAAIPEEQEEKRKTG